MTSPNWATAKIDAELAALLNDVVAGTPTIEGKSEIVRDGIYLKLSELLREKRISDPALRLRVYECLHRANRGISAIGETVSHD